MRIRSAPRPREWPWAVALGAVAVVVNAWRIGDPSLMGDEAVTVAIASRSPGAIWAVVSTSMDAVHAAYYTGMHVWFGALGADAWTLRLPSAIGVGIGVCGIVLIGTTFVSRTVGISAGVLLTVLPATVLAATVGRSQGLQIALITWTAFILLLALERGGAWRWVAFGALVFLSLLVFLFTALVVCALVVAVLVHRPWRARIVPVGISVVVAGLLASPVAILGYQQRGQVSWIEPIGPEIAQNVLVTQWFSGVIRVDGSYPEWIAYVSAALFLGLAVLGAVVAVRQGGVIRGVAVLGILWMTLPSILLVGVSLVATPFYSPPYLTMCGPAVALLAAFGIGSVAWSWMRAALLIAAVVLSVPPYLAARDETAHGTDWNEIARTLEREAETGDGVLIENEPWDQPHLLFDLYPDETSELRDISLLGHTNAVALWGDRSTPDDLEIGTDVQRIWIVSTGDGTGEWESSLIADGFAPAETVDLPYSRLTLFTR